jgi:hypothetical protein
MKKILCLGLRLLRAVRGSVALALAVSSSTALVRADVVAHSIDDWAPGQQGTNGWFYGRYEISADASANGYTAVPGGIDDFRPFETSGDFPRFGFINGVWDYIGAGGAPVDPPWTSMGQTGVHPDSENQPGGERWAIRRYVVQPNDVATGGNLAVVWRMQKVNPAGLGVTGTIFHNGIAIDSQVIGGDDKVGIARGIFVPNVQAGDFLDLAYTPVGMGGNASDQADGGAHTMAIRNNAVPFAAYSAVNVSPLPGFDAEVHADSIAEFSGVQGQNNWYYGYFNKTIDDQNLANGYQASDFIEFPTTGDLPRFGFRGGSWGYTGTSGTAVSPPFTSVSTTSVHPNGLNSAAAAGGIGEHWPIRRWVSEREGSVRIEGFFRDNNTHCGDGTTARIFVDGAEVWTQRVTKSTDTSFAVTAAVQVDSKIDFAVDSGPSRGDSCDSTVFTARVVSPPGRIEVLADSAADFSGVQGQDGWRYGFWDRTRDEFVDADGDGVYEPAEFVEFGSAAEHGFNGTRWGWLGGAGPATGLSSSEAQPNGSTGPVDPADDAVQWAVRRWTSDFDGVVQVAGQLSPGENDGDGVVARIFVDGDEVYSALVTEPTPYSLYVPLHAGSIVDFALDAGFVDDGTFDATGFTATISMAVPIPEPSAWALAVVALALVTFQKLRGATGRLTIRPKQL